MLMWVCLKGSRRVVLPAPRVAVSWENVSPISDAYQAGGASGIVITSAFSMGER